MTITPYIGIFIPQPGQTNYDQPFAQGMMNIDQHDHSGGPNKGLPITSSGLSDFSVTYNKLASNVADPATGIGVSGTLPNQLKLLGILPNIFNLASSGFITKDGVLAHSRVFQDTASITWTNPDGVAGNPSAVLATNTVNPNQSLFLAKVALQSAVTGDGSDYQVLFDTTLINQGGDYDTGTSEYTAPVSGNYYFNVNLLLGKLSNVTSFVEIDLFVNTIKVDTLVFQSTNAIIDNPGSGSVVLGGSQLMVLNATDVVTVNLNVANNANVGIDVKGGDFTGFLLPA